MDYPAWAYFPRQTVAPDWVEAFLSVVRGRQADVDSASHDGLKSDGVVSALRDDLVLAGWQVEAGKQPAQKIHRPVLFGDNGAVRVKQEIDAWHPGLGIVMEIESGRGIQGNAVYRDLVRASLIAEAQYLVLGVRSRYMYGAKNTVNNDFLTARDLLDSIFASGRLGLPFKGVLVFGW